MKGILLCTLFVLTSCYQNGRDAIASHQVIAEPKQRFIHWEEDAPVNVTQARINEVEPCQRLLLY